MIFDHLAVAGETLEVAVAHIEQALGVRMSAGGQHELFGTHNALLGLADGLYLEAIAVDPMSKPPGRARWFALDEFSGPPRITNWICRTDAIAQALGRLPEGSGMPVDVARGDLRWRMAVPENGKLPFHGAMPALIQWVSGGHPAKRLPNSGCQLRRLIVSHPDADMLNELLTPVFSDPRLRIETGPVHAFCAEFDTPTGRRVLQ